MLSSVEHVERVRALPAARRWLYSVVLSGVVAASFVGAIAVAILLAYLMFTVINGEPPTIEDVMVLAVPIILAFMAAIGFSSNPDPLGRPLREVAARAARYGVKNGFISGFIFGVGWSLIAGLAAVLYERWDLIFRREVLVFGVALGLAISPSLALYRAFTSVVEPVVFDWVIGRRATS